MAGVGLLSKETLLGGSLLKPFMPLFLCAVATTSFAAEPFELRDGDRVVLLGNTLIEREQKYGYWETALTLRFPERNVIFRNLGWSGDTVWGEARAGFDTPKEGFRRLVEHTLALKPTVIILGYGCNESFAGEAGLAAFREQLDTLSDALAPSKARFILLAPPMFEETRSRAGHFAERQRDLQLYTETIRQVAKKRQFVFTEEFCQTGRPAAPVTENGMHLSARGYAWTARGLLNALDLLDGWRLKTVELVGEAPIQIRNDFLPNPGPYPRGADIEEFQGDSFVRARGLQPGKYTLKIDGRPVQTEDSATWMKPDGQSVLVLKGPSLDQVKQLRHSIVEKNRLYFYRWRPQNETYLFGFRKHEQGQNAREVPLFDPLVAKKEKEIAGLRTPVPHRYELVRESEEKP